MSSINPEMCNQVKWLAGQAAPWACPLATPPARPDGVIHTRAAIGTGPVDATHKGIDQIVNVPCNFA